jgi:thiol-disulfide isomerase/thioredoxin
MNDFLDRRRAVALGVAVAVGGVLAFLAKDALRPPDVRPPAAAVPAKVTLPSGPLLVKNREGAARDLAMRTGRGLILHFWATWCAPCREEMPALAKFVNDTKGDRNVEFLAVSVDEDWGVAERWLKDGGITGLPLALDPKGPTSRLLGATGYPETFFVAPSGEILRHIVGAADWNDRALRDFAAEFSRASAASKG